ncbi:hypothetical protein ACFSGI_18475 [Paenibacillus nicotianae]|uniref:Immunity protein 30 n=1 Tax=Paenibacillus nicotianae TaxID=1526551 RepID=A0ABW4V0Y2_9BACL
MYRELDNLLSANTTVDSWYNDGCTIASEILSEFNKEDWGKLSIEIFNKSLEWQKKIAYCLDSNCNIYELKILLSLLETKDEELFQICIDTLRSFTTSENKQMIIKNASILQRINNLLPKSGIAVKKVLEDFVIKIYS